MVKDPKDPRKWTNVEIETDSEGYLKAQKAYAQEQEKQRRDATFVDDGRHTM
jgi:3-phenylpropionate/cinnamic acid dioxygenase small subunit